MQVSPKSRKNWRFCTAWMPVVCQKDTFFYVIILFTNNFLWVIGRYYLCKLKMFSRPYSLTSIAAATVQKLKIQKVVHPFFDWFWTCGSKWCRFQKNCIFIQKAQAYSDVSSIHYYTCSCIFQEAKMKSILCAFLIFTFMNLDKDPDVAKCYSNSCFKTKKPVQNTWLLIDLHPNCWPFWGNITIYQRSYLKWITT